MSFSGIKSFIRSVVQTVQLVWTTNPLLTFFLAVFAVFLGLLPAAIAYVGKWILDGVIAVINVDSRENLRFVYQMLALEAGLAILLMGLKRGNRLVQTLLRAQLGHKVNELILAKSLRLTLVQFENSELYDKITQARRGASTRPLSLILQVFQFFQETISLAAYSVLLFRFSPFALVFLALSSLPNFITETKFSQEAFRLFKWHSPEGREQLYLETLIAREDHVKEVKLFGLGPLFLNRYIDIFKKVYKEDKWLNMRRAFWGYVFSLISTLTFYGIYAWIILSTVRGMLTIGDMSMYLVVFQQGQGSIQQVLSAIGGMYEDKLYLDNLEEFLNEPESSVHGVITAGARPGDGIRFENVSFTYPGGTTPALDSITLHIKPGEKLAIVGVNGSGKSTLMKLLAGLYEPDKGRVLLDGVDLKEWSPEALHSRLAIIFQDFVQYQFSVGENIGAGDISRLSDKSAWQEAALKADAHTFIKDLPVTYDTQLGRWFKDGRELSVGQWQKIALSRAFFRKSADIIILDEPTASMDPQAEFDIFERIMAETHGKILLLISHRFSNVRMADRIIVLSKGKLIEEGSHSELLKLNGVYTQWFSVQAKGYFS